LKFKIDENLPVDCAVIPRDAGFEADTVFDERLTGADDSVIASRSQAAERVLVTLDLDFSNIRAYPPSRRAGIIVLRPKRQDKRMVLHLMGRIVLALANRTPAGELWIVETDRIRFRST
jgi:predicted nuclease of predicted toxin-antitoxin system